ncbi:hypothetical protein [Noviherbaspirillum humi]|nr:hypothetical protein [Noviherbaspirillum humi]
MHINPASPPEMPSPGGAPEITPSTPMEPEIPPAPESPTGPLGPDGPEVVPDTSPAEVPQTE